MTHNESNGFIKFRDTDFQCIEVDDEEESISIINKNGNRVNIDFDEFHEMYRDIFYSKNIW